MKKIIIYTQAYNAEKTLRRTIESVLGQTYSDFVYYILDNGSSDRTGEIIAEYALRDNRIVFLVNQVNNIWLKGERWAGFLDQYSDDSFFCMLDADDEYKVEFLEKIVAFINKEQLEIAVCGNDFIDTQTNNTFGVRNIKHNLIIEGNRFNDCFPIYHQYMRTIWAKAYSVSVLRKPDYKTYKLLGYGADTIFAMNAFHNASRVGILAESLHKYYVSPKSVSYKFDERRIASDQILFDAARDFLISKCGTVSNENLNFLFLVYLNALDDTLNVLFKAQISVADKLRNLLNICRSKQTQELIKWPAAAAEKNKLFSQIALWVLSQAEVRNGDELDTAADIFAEIGMYPSKASGWPDSLVFLLLTKIKDKQNELGQPSQADKHIVTIAEASPFLKEFDADFLAFFRDVVISILQRDENKALSQVIEAIDQETDIPDQYIETFLTLGLNLSAKLEQTGDFIFFKKLYISYLIDCTRINEAQEELADWDEMLPDDMDFRMLRARLTQ